VKKLDSQALPVLADEIRSFLLEHVSRTGGHLASNLGIVELTLAIHRVFDTEKDRIIFDVGHQCYVHKLLTGRRDAFSTLRSLDGLSGFPKPCESDSDAFVAGHASNSISIACGMAKARTLKGEDYDVVAVIGDGALTGGLAYEGLNYAGQSGEHMLVILNDNGMSISENVGGLANYLSRKRSKPGYYRFKQRYRRLYEKTAVGRRLYRFNHRIKTAVKHALLPAGFFEDMGFTYLGPVDGHDLETLTYFLQYARTQEGPVLLHVHTKKGKGYDKAEQVPDLYHGVSAFDVEAGVSPEQPEDFSARFGQSLTRLASADNRICAITAAMTESVGLAAFFQRFPARSFDVGIAEQHAVSMAGGLAKQGMTPVVTVYSTFLQRAYDMIIHDVAISNLHVVFAVDRAGITGRDGETHQGTFDVPFLTQVPHMTVLCPASYAELDEMLRAAVGELEGPVAVRYPRGCEGAYQACADWRKTAVLREGSDVTLVTYGILVNNALGAAELLAAEGISAQILKLGTAAPLDTETLLEAARSTRRMLVLEDCVDHGSVGERIGALLESENIPMEGFVRQNIGQSFVPHGDVSALYARYGLDARGVTDAARDLLAGQGGRHG